jgi:hypothetical protein
MTAIPTGAEHINRRARVLTDVRDRRDGDVVYLAGSTVIVKDVRPALGFGGTQNNSVGFRRVTISAAGRRPAVTSANNLELIDDAPYPPAAGVSATVHVAGQGGAGGASSFGGGGRVSRDLTDVKALGLAHAHDKVAKAYKELSYALNDLKSVERL